MPEFVGGVTVPDSTDAASQPVSVCVLCGRPWEPSVKNVCECGGFCTWGRAKDADPDSWIVTDKGWTPRPMSHADPHADDGGVPA